MKLQTESVLSNNYFSYRGAFKCVTSIQPLFVTVRTDLYYLVVFDLMAIGVLLPTRTGYAFIVHRVRKIRLGRELDGEFVVGHQ